VAHDAVEERPEQACRGHAHVLGRLVAEQLQHHELARGQPRHALGERRRAREQLRVGHGLEDHAHARGLRGRDLVVLGHVGSSLREGAFRGRAGVFP
jgi:hypothetical protein